MGLLSTIKERIFGRRPEKPPENPEAKPENIPEVKPAASQPQTKPEVKPEAKTARSKPHRKPEEKPEVKPEAKPAASQPQAKPAVKPSDVKVNEKVEVVQKEEKPVAEKISIGELHLSGCTGCLVTLADNYEGLFKLLDDYADLVYALTLVDVRHVPEMDVCLVEGSCCLNDKISVDELKEARAKSKVLVAYGACAAYGNITRFCRGGQWNQPGHEAFVPISEVVDVDLYIPSCPPCPQQVRNVAIMAYLLLRGNDEQKNLATAYLTPLMQLAQRGNEACGCDLMYDVINQGLCMGCGTCAGTCPVRAITMEYGKPNVNRDQCIKCGACYAQCPRSWFNFDVMNNYEGIMDAIKGAMQ
jgi:coenzyme F420 hydrogenase, subunit gamma